jgi:hypothetical protein
MTRVRPRIFVFGGSNSVMKNGWMTHFKAAAEAEYEIINRSLGGATTLMGLYRLFETPELGPGDIAIWEYGVNDHSASNKMTERLLVENFAWFLHEARARGAHVFALMMCGSRYASDYALGRPPIYYTTQTRRLLRRYRVPSLDLFDLLHTRYGRGPGAEAAVKGLYEDRWHYRTDGDLLSEVAAKVLAQLRTFDLTTPTTALDIKFLRGRRLLFRRAFQGDEGRTFSNSLVSSSYIEIGGAVDIGVRAYLKAVIVLASVVGGSVVLPDTRGNGSRAYSLRLVEQLPTLKGVFAHIVTEFTNWPRIPLVGPIVQTRRAERDEKIYAEAQFKRLSSPEGENDGVVAFILEDATDAFTWVRRWRLASSDWAYLPRHAFRRLRLFLRAKRG